MSRPEGAVGERIELHVLAPLRVLVDGVEPGLVSAPATLAKTAYIFLTA